MVSVLSQLTSLGVSHPNYEPDRAVLLIYFALLLLFLQYES